MHRKAERTRTSSRVPQPISGSGQGGAARRGRGGGPAGECEVEGTSVRREVLQGEHNSLCWLLLTKVLSTMKTWP